MHGCTVHRSKCTGAPSLAPPEQWRVTCGAEHARTRARTAHMAGMAGMAHQAHTAGRRARAHTTRRGCKGRGRLKEEGSYSPVYAVNVGDFYGRVQRSRLCCT